MTPAPAINPAWTDARVAVFAGTFDSHIKTGEDYPTRTLAEIFAMQPEAKAKGAGLAFVPSSYHDYDAREHAVQRERGMFVALTGDIDSGDHAPRVVQEAVRAFAGDAAHMIYTSAHARPGDMRWRIILPLADAVDFATWHDAQTAFFDFMAARGIEMDRALARAAQPVYLPNVPAVHVKTDTALRGEDNAPLYYRATATPLTAPGLILDVGPVAAGIAALRRQRIEDERAREAIRREAEARRAASPRGQGASMIDDFNAANSVATMLELCGYQQSPRHPEDWRSPYQQGDTYATRVMGSKWVSLSASDAAAQVGTQCAAGCFGDAYDLYAHYKHGGDHKAAYRALRAEMRAADGNVIYPAQYDEPPEWMGEIPEYDEMPDWAEGERVFEPEEELGVEQDADTDSTFELFSLADLESLPPPAWLIHETISEDGLTIMYGDPGAGKSFVALDMALRVSLGLSWHGVKTKRVGVLYIAGEGVRGLGKRVAGWRLKHGLDMADAQFALLPTAVQFLDDADRAKLVRTIDEVKRRLGWDVGLMVIDTVSRAIAGCDENGQETMSAFVKACDDVRSHTGGAVIGIHHSGKDKERGMRGSTVLLGACDASIRLTKDDETVTLSVEKQKDAEEAKPVYMRMEKFAWQAGGGDQAGEELTTLIPMLSDAPLNAEAQIGRQQVREAFGALADAWTQGRPLSHRPETKKDGRYAPSILSKQFGGKADGWVSLIASWLENGCLSYEIYDRRQKARGLQVINAVV